MIREVSSLNATTYQIYLAARAKTSRSWPRRLDAVGSGLSCPAKATLANELDFFLYFGGEVMIGAAIMTGKAKILFLSSAGGGDRILAPRCEDSDSEPRQECGQRQQRPRAHAERTWADARPGHLISGMPRVFICSLNDIAESRSAAWANSVGVEFARALGEAVRHHVSRESQCTQWIGISPFVVR